MRECRAKAVGGRRAQVLHERQTLHALGNPALSPWLAVPR